ncbi:MAG: hypothetical protein AAFY15_06800 [Cyanobacteria bacterium J06648_11]
MAQYIGFIEGFLRWQESTTFLGFPLPKILEANLTYSGTLSDATSLSPNAVAGASGSCLVSEEASIQLSATDLEWVMLQISTATLAEDWVGNVPVVQTLRPQDAAFTTDTTYTLSQTPTTGITNTVVADYEGNQYAHSIAGSVLTITGQDTSDRPLAVIYERDISASPEQAINVGSGPKLPVFGLYGTFYSCDGPDLLLIANKAVVQPSLNFSTGGGNPASVGPTIKLLRDSNENFFSLVRQSA